MLNPSWLVLQHLEGIGLPVVVGFLFVLKNIVASMEV
jgi:hypothetical protein